MSQSYGSFAGKAVFSSPPGGGGSYYLTTWQVSGGGPDGSPLLLPAMSAVTVTEQERCLLYAQPDGSYRIQLDSLLWIGFDANLGWLTLTPDVSGAVPILLLGSPQGQQWQIKTGDGNRPVLYNAGGTSPILVAGDPGDPPSLFVPSTATPSLAAIRAAGGDPGGDLAKVNFHGSDLSKLDLTGADLTAADLTGASLAGSDLTGARLCGAVLGGVCCDLATLDQADLTGADLTGVAWGSPARAQGLVLTHCSARGAVLGGQSAPLDCAGANLGGGDFRGADLRGLLLNGAQGRGALLANCRLDGAVLDEANLAEVIAVGASLKQASLQGVSAQSANFVRADLTGANLTRARLGARAYLFGLSGSSYVTELDQYPYVQPDLVAAFAANGITLAPTDPVTVLAEGSHWAVEDPAGPYLLVAKDAETIDVWSENPALRPAVLAGSTGDGAILTGASLSGADLRGVEWYGARLDHADLEGADLSGSLLAQADLTQAYLSGAALSRSALVGAQFRGCLIGPGSDRTPFALDGAQLQGADFSDATVLGGLLIDAGVALPQGVPLFTLPPGSEQDLNQQSIQKLAPAFAQAGYPLGSAPTVTLCQLWLLDNAGEPDPLAPRSYRVQKASDKLPVYDGESGRYLFALPKSDEALLNQPTASSALVAAFYQAGYALEPLAPIAPQQYWEIHPSADGLEGAVAYPTMRVYQETANLPVYGSVLVLLRDWPQFPGGLAFAATQALDTALDATSIGPSGYPRGAVDQGWMSWEEFLRGDFVGVAYTGRG
ncbi:MAG: pentapeptide repeat-containing protein [Mycobacterium leprae]